jgi:hypothetical protein
MNSKKLIPGLITFAVAGISSWWFFKNKKNGLPLKPTPTAFDQKIEKKQTVIDAPSPTPTDPQKIEKNWETCQEKDKEECPYRGGCCTFHREKLTCSQIQSKFKKPVKTKIKQDDFSKKAGEQSPHPPQNESSINGVDVQSPRPQQNQNPIGTARITRYEVILRKRLALLAEIRSSLEKKEKAVEEERNKIEEEKRKLRQKQQFLNAKINTFLKIQKGFEEKTKSGRGTKGKEEILEMFRLIKEEFETMIKELLRGIGMGNMSATFSTSDLVNLVDDSGNEEKNKTINFSAKGS